MPDTKASNDDARLEMYQDMLSRALRHYWENLKSSIRGRRYLKERGVSSESIAKFGIGYADVSKQGLRKVFPNYQVQALVECGLVVDRPGARADRFRDRIMFPILSDGGRVIGFGGRVIDGDRAKYLNSPETPLFQKGSLLFGVPQAQKAIAETGSAVIVEGYLDVVMSSQHGVGNVVSTLGTATTSAHIKTLAGFSKRVVFCFDGDRAGTNAAVKAMKACAGVVGVGLDVGFAFLPADEDPDSYVRKHGVESFLNRIDSALSFESFLLRYLRHGKDLTSSEGRAAFASESLELLNMVRDAGLFYRLIESVSRASRFTVAELLSFTDPAVERAWSTNTPVQTETLQTASA